MKKLCILISVVSILSACASSKHGVCDAYGNSHSAGKYKNNGR
jgi:hypothetical protein